jgi:hypothetical protein
MKLFLIAILLGGTFALSATNASAAVCARGVYRAGCAGPRGAIVAHRPVVAPRVVAPRLVAPRVVAPRVVAPRVVCARGVYRAGCVTR